MLDIPVLFQINSNVTNGRYNEVFNLLAPELFF